MLAVGFTAAGVGFAAGCLFWNMFVAATCFVSVLLTGITDGFEFWLRRGFAPVKADFAEGDPTKRPMSVPHLGQAGYTRAGIVDKSFTSAGFWNILLQVWFGQR